MKDCLCTRSTGRQGRAGRPVSGALCCESSLIPTPETGLPAAGDCTAAGDAEAGQRGQDAPVPCPACS